MVRRYGPLSELQVEILRWVEQGCPARDDTTASYKTTVYALANRGLVTVDRRRRAWSATMTEAGWHYLAHGTYPPVVDTPRSGKATRAPSTARKSVPSATADTPAVSVESMLRELADAEGTLTVEDPSESVRAAYRRAISRAITGGVVPDGFVLRHSGRDHGPLRIRLVPRSQVPHSLPAVPVPHTLSDGAELVRMLQRQPHLLDVSDHTRLRALLIAQAIADECGRRGYPVGLRDEQDPSFAITVGEDRFGVVICEEWEQGEAPEPEKLAAAKYDWQRIPLSVRSVRSGRLRLDLQTESGTRGWADRTRWTLEQKLPHLFAEIATRAADLVRARTRREEERVRRRAEWDDAIHRARQGYVDQFNRDRLREQLARSAEAEAIRSYCTRLQVLADEINDVDRRTPITQWVRWATDQADRLDPVNNLEELGFVVPGDISARDLAPYMPRWLSPYHPPS
ncbi:hypothetical protein [Rhodococcus gordoniae]|uniref:hypothetical protein n=1 Tax=Rhodococcus gordoniae TaxID=223392 RepID=UPI0020CCB9D1|nr:hypothetical protein [Rhodococcus gordoniae]UTT51181.1 hypothetical protein NMQ04_23080 [Rhodococcus gordoniae]